MTRNTLCILVCDSFKAEMDAIASCAAAPEVTFATYPARCGRPPLDWEEIRSAAGQEHGGNIALLGGCCLARLAPPKTHCVSTTTLDNCFTLLLSRYAVETYLSDGAYLVTSGWLKSWRQRMDEWGFDRQCAREFFAESFREVVLVDSGVSASAGKELEEFSRFVDRPCRTVPAGLDLMTSHVERNVERWRTQQEAKRVSEYAMAFDLLGSLTEMTDEEQVAQCILNCYGILFGAATVAYVVMAEGKGQRVVRPDSRCREEDAQLLQEAEALECDYRLLDDSGFLLAIRHNGSVFGVVRARGLALACYRDQYVSLALSIAPVWGLALDNARSFQRIREITRQLEERKRVLEGINTIFKVALSARTLEDLGGTCLSVAERLTGSAFGFVSEMGADGLLHDIAISDPGWELCTMYDQSGQRRPPGDFKIHGLYGSVVLQGESILANAPAQHAHSIGVPPGHPPLACFLGVPLMEEDRVVGVIALANRPGGYGPEQLEGVEALAPAVVAALRRKRAEEALQQANEMLEQRVEERTRELADREARRLEAEQALHQETVKRLGISETLREKERLLIQQSRLAALGEMINNIAHQWRQPLNAVGLLVQDLQQMYEYGELKESCEQHVEKVMAVIGHMSQTIDDFRNFFKPDKEKVEFHIAAVVAKSLSLVEDGFRALGIEVEVAATADPVVTGYANEFAQVLLNILTNARDAFQEGARAGRRAVRITIAQEGEKAVVTLADNAGGIAEEIIGKIFDPYFTTKGPDKGTGVGLYMAKMIIVKSMSGTLEVRNLDGGAQFRIVL